MDWSGKFEELKGEISALSCKADKMAQAYAEAEDFTRKFLARCSAHKIKVVSIATRTKLIKECSGFPFSVEYSVFAEGESTDGFPKIWSVVDELDISGGCGNYNQHQVSGKAMSKLINGVYEFKDKKWNKIR